MKNIKPAKILVLIVAIALGLQLLNTFFRQRHGYFECRTEGNPTYYFEFRRSFLTLQGSCPKTGAFNPAAVTVGDGGIENCLRILDSVQSQGAACEAVEGR